MNTADRVVRNPSLALAPGDDGVLAYDAEASRLHRLNPAAALIVELCDGTRSVSQICDELAPVVGAAGPEACARWIDKAKTDGLLKSLDAAAPLPTPPSPQDLASLAYKLRKQGSVLASFVCQYHAAQLLPGSADEWCYLGEIAHIIGRREDAREAYEHYLTLEPGDAEVQHILVALRDEPPPPRAPDRCIQQLYERFAGFYESSMVGTLDYQAPRRLAEALDAELGGLGNLDVLEIGCGTGLAGRHLRPRARRLTGIDLSPEMIAHAEKTELYDVLEVAEITAWLGREDGPRFDLVAACDTLIYFGDLRQVTIPAARRIHPGGWLAFTVERSQTPPFQLTDSGRYAHSEEHIITAAGDAGFSVARVSEAVVRYEYGEPVVALVAVLKRT